MFLYSTSYVRHTCGVTYSSHPTNYILLITRPGSPPPFHRAEIWSDAHGGLRTRAQSSRKPNSTRTSVTFQSGSYVTGTALHHIRYTVFIQTIVIITIYAQFEIICKRICIHRTSGKCRLRVYIYIYTIKSNVVVPNLWWNVFLSYRIVDSCTRSTIKTLCVSAFGPLFIPFRLRGWHCGGQRYAAENCVLRLIRMRVSCIFV